jgi:hypothetical protein
LLSIRAFFSSQDDVTTEDWANKASFSWALHADHMGRPGPSISSLITWPLGDYDELRDGGWLSGEAEWWLPDSALAGSWLVGSWPDEAIGIVAIGSEAAAPLLSSVAGLDDGHGDITWMELQYHAILTEIVILSSGVSSAGGVAAQTVSTLNAPSFLIIRETSSQSYSSVTDTILPPEDSGLTWADSLAMAARTLRYGVVTLCDTDTSAAAWTETIEVDNEVTTAIIPERDNPTDATVRRRSGWDIVPHLTPFGDELILRFVPAETLTPDEPLSSALHAVELQYEVSYAIFDILGRLQREGRAEVKIAGAGAAIMRITGTGNWASGVYFCRVRFGDHVVGVKVLHIK